MTYYPKKAYNECRMKLPAGVSKEKFDAVLRGLLNSPPMPLADIPRKRKPRAKAKGGAKRREKI